MEASRATIKSLAPGERFATEAGENFWTPARRQPRYILPLGGLPCPVAYCGDDDFVLFGRNLSVFCLCTAYGGRSMPLAVGVYCSSPVPQLIPIADMGECST